MIAQNGARLEEEPRRVGKNGEKRRDPEEVPRVDGGGEEEDRPEEEERGAKRRSLSQQKGECESAEDRGGHDLGGLERAREREENVKEAFVATPPRSVLAETSKRETACGHVRENRERTEEGCDPEGARLTEAREEGKDGESPELRKAGSGGQGHGKVPRPFSNAESARITKKTAATSLWPLPAISTTGSGLQA